MATRPERPPSEYLSLCWLSQHNVRRSDGGQAREAAISAPVAMLAEAAWERASWARPGAQPEHCRTGSASTTMGAPMVARQERPSSGHLPLCWLSQHSDRCPDGGLSGLAAIEAPIIVLAQLGQYNRAISYGPGHTLHGRAAQSLLQAVKNDSPSPECTRGL
jgi:hypothetical protein